MTSFTLSENLESRLDKFLTEKFPSHSRSYFQYLIDKEYVLINGHPVKKQYRPAKGDQIQVLFQAPQEIGVAPEKIPLNLLYEDEEILAINKPAGMVVHPAPGSPSQTFANALLYHCQGIDPDEFAPLRPGIVHRLDKETSGVLIGAKTPRAHQALSSLFSSRKVEKNYLALCAGLPKEGLFSAPLKRHPIRRKEMAIDPSGKEAMTEFKTLISKEGIALVEAKLITGRTHQIRVHLKGLNCPIIGDPVYGSLALNKKYKVTRQLLHAYSVAFTHPLSGKLLKIVAPLPLDMKNFIDLIDPSRIISILTL